MSLAARADDELAALLQAASLNGVGVEGTLIQPLRKVPVTAQLGDDGPFALYHHDSAWTLSQVSDSKLRERREAAGEVTMQRFTSAVNASGGVFTAETGSRRTVPWTRNGAPRS